MENVITGSCRCGAVEYSFKGDPRVVVNCHCDDCKRRNGSVYSTYLAVSEKRVTIAKGEQLLKRYGAENVGEKCFCIECGSPIFNINYRLPGILMMFYGTLDQVKDFTPTYNVYCESKHDWVDEINSIKSFDTSIER